MISLLQQLEPTAQIGWSAQKVPSVTIKWLHGENRTYPGVAQTLPPQSPATVIPQAIFNIGDGQYMWEESTW